MSKSDKERVEELTQMLCDLIKPNDQKNKAAEMGMMSVYAYHCNRCNYLWFPRDYDYRPTSPILEMTPPKACARCKSKYWNKIPQREAKNYDNMLGVPRIMALKRYGLKYYIDRFGSPEGFVKVYEEFLTRNPDIKTVREFNKAFRKEYGIPEWISHPTELIAETIELINK